MTCIRSAVNWSSVLQSLPRQITDDARQSGGNASSVLGLLNCLLYRNVSCTKNASVAIQRCRHFSHVWNSRAEKMKSTSCLFANLVEITAAGRKCCLFFSQFCCLDSLFFVEGCRNTFHMRRKGRLIAVLETVDTVDLLVKLQWTCLERWLFYNESSSLRFEMVRIDRIEANIYADLVNLHHILVLFLPNIFKNCFEWVFRPGTWFHD